MTKTTNTLAAPSTTVRVAAAPRIVATAARNLTANSNMDAETPSWCAAGKVKKEKVKKIKPAPRTRRVQLPAPW